MDPLHQVMIDRWDRDVSARFRHAAMLALERGKLIYLPYLGYTLRDGERRFLASDWVRRGAAHISYDDGPLRGAQGMPIDLAGLQAMMARFRFCASRLVRTLFPGYTLELQTGSTSYHAHEIRRPSAYRRDETRLHIDVDETRPLNGDRILRVYTNVNPELRPHLWRLGEPFEAAAARFLADAPRPSTAVAWLYDALGGRRRARRNDYDRMMRQLHDRMKADSVYQGTSPSVHIAFPPGSTWVAFSDQVVHASLSGPFVLAQTFYLPVHAMSNPENAPLRVLDRLMRRPGAMDEVPMPAILR